jgi:hypothetical protein
MPQSVRTVNLLPVFLILTIGAFSQSPDSTTGKPIRLGEIYDVLRLDLPEEPIEKRNRTLVHAVNTRGIDFDLTDALAADLVKEGANSELIGAIRKVSDANRLTTNKIEARKHFQDFEACGKDDADCRLASLDKAISLDPKENLYSDWRRIVDEQRPKTGTANPASPKRGKKSGKILYSAGYTSYVEGKGPQNQILQTNFSVTEEFHSALISRLKSAGLELDMMTSLQERERSQYFGAIHRRSRDEKALQFLPYGIIVSVNVDNLADLEDTNGLKASEVTGSIELIDTETGKAIGFYSFERVRGFGSTQDAARKNALRDAATRIPDSFIKEIVEKAR